MQNQGSIGLYNNIDSTKKSQLSENILIPYFSLYSDRIVIHPKPFNAITKKSMHINSIKNLEKPKFKGNISQTQKSIIKKKLTAWLNGILEHNIHYRKGFNRKEFYPVFLTVTLSQSQKHTDKEIKKRMLDLLIKNLKNRYKINKYFWRAEAQKNGNIHFHIITDKYIPYEELKTIWNKIQEKNGYLENYIKKTGHNQPNSVDIRSASQVENFINYVLKYVAKDEKARKIEGRVFGMSDELRNINIYQDILDSHLSDEIIKYKKHKYFKEYKSDYYTVLLFEKSFYNTSFYNYLKNISHSYYLKVFDRIYKGEKTKTYASFKFKEKLIENSVQLSMFKIEEQMTSVDLYNYTRKNT